MKIIFTSFLFLILFSTLTPAFAQSVVSQTNINVSRCTVNGQVVPCDVAKQAAKEILSNFMLPVIGFVLLMTTLFAFWIWMIVHAATHDIPDKVMWILILMLLQLLGAIIYYFVVKRKFVPAKSPTV